MALKHTPIDIEAVGQVPIRRFVFVMRYIAKHDLWDELEMHLEELGCTEMIMSQEPFQAIQAHLLERVSRGEDKTTGGRRVANSVGCFGGHPTPPPKPPPSRD